MNIKLSVTEERMPEAFRAFSRETAADEYEILIREDLPELEKYIAEIRKLVSPGRRGGEI